MPDTTAVQPLDKLSWEWKLPLYYSLHSTSPAVRALDGLLNEPSDPINRWRSFENEARILEREQCRRREGIQRGRLRGLGEQHRLAARPSIEGKVNKTNGMQRGT